MITYEELKKGPIKMGKIKEARPVSGSDRMLYLLVDFGTEKRTVAASMANFYKPEDLIGKIMPFIVDIAPITLMGVKSEAMILCPHDEKPVFLIPEREVAPGTPVF